MKEMFSSLKGKYLILGNCLFVWSHVMLNVELLHNINNRLPGFKSTMDDLKANLSISTS